MRQSVAFAVQTTFFQRGAPHVCRAKKCEEGRCRVYCNRGRECACACVGYTAIEGGSVRARVRVRGDVAQGVPQLVSVSNLILRHRHMFVVALSLLFSRQQHFLLPF